MSHITPNAECLYAECRYAKRRYAECHDAVKSIITNTGWTRFFQTTTKKKFCETGTLGIKILVSSFLHKSGDEKIPGEYFPLLFFAIFHLGFLSVETSSQLKHRLASCCSQGSLTEAEGSVRLTSLYFRVCISFLRYWKYYLPFIQNKLP